MDQSVVSNPNQIKRGVLTQKRPGSITALGVIYIVLSILQVLVAILILTILENISTSYSILLFISGIIHFLVAIALLKLKKWAWYVAVVFSVFYLASLLGIIIFFLLIKKDTRRAVGLKVKEDANSKPI